MRKILIAAVMMSMVGAVACKKDDDGAKKEPDKKTATKTPDASVPKPTPAADATPAAAVMPPVADKSLYDRLGGAAAIKAVVHDFVDIVGKDARVNKRFAKTDIPALEQKLNDFACQATGGGCQYTGKTMADAHKGMKITEEEFNAIAEDMTKALEKNNVPDKEKGELMGALAGLKGDIVGK
jgi:hemoglobin